MDRRTAARTVIGLAALASVAAALAAAARRVDDTTVDAATRQPGNEAPAWLRAFVTRRFNPVVTRLGLVGGRRSPWAYLEHAGRRSGTVHRAPVLPMVVGDYVFVPLPYGVDVNWTRNVRAAGHCRLQRRGVVYALDEPAVVEAGEHPGLPARYRSVLERRRRRYLRLHVLSAMPGTLDDVPVEGVAWLPAHDVGASRA